MPAKPPRRDPRGHSELVRSRLRQGLVSGQATPKARLAWYAQHLHLVEVNSSFYAVPDPAAVARWSEETPRDFVFDVKLHQYLSRHSTSIKFLPPELRSLAKVQRDKAEWNPDLEAALVKRILRSVAPLEDAGKMGSFLLQMSPAFRPRTHRLTDLDPLLDLLAGHRLAVELRNRDWLIGAYGCHHAGLFRTTRCHACRGRCAPKRSLHGHAERGPGNQPRVRLPTCPWPQCGVTCAVVPWQTASITNTPKTSWLASPGGPSTPGDPRGGDSRGLQQQQIELCAPGGGTLSRNDRIVSAPVSLPDRRACDNASNRFPAF